MLPVEEDAADAARLVAVRQEEILVAPGLELRVVGDGRVLLAGELHGLVEGERIGIVLRAAPVEHRRQVGAAAEPPARGHHHARVHVHGRHVGIVRVRDQRNAARPEARVLLGARHLLAELGRELAVDGRDVDADLLEDAAVHHRHGAAAALALVALPRRALEAAGRPPRRLRAATRSPASRRRRRCGRAGSRTRYAPSPSCPRCRPAALPAVRGVPFRSRRFQRFARAGRPGADKRLVFSGSDP